jgi:hypothetical protein
MMHKGGLLVFSVVNYWWSLAELCSETPASGIAKFAAYPFKCQVYTISKDSCKTTAGKPPFVSSMVRCQ